MRTSMSLRAAGAFALALAFGACDDSGPKEVDVGGAAQVPPTDTETGNVGSDAGAALTACVDRPPPAAAPAAPNGALPCTLLPPGFVAQR